MDIKKITTDPNKKIEPENAIWSNFVCKATILGEEIANLESNINQISDHQKTPFFNFSDSLKGIDRVICLPFSLTLKHKINLEATVSLWSCLETLIKDHLINNINTNPLLAIKINNDEKLKKRLDLIKLTSAI